MAMCKPKRTGFPVVTAVVVVAAALAVSVAVAWLTANWPLALAAAAGTVAVAVAVLRAVSVVSHRLARSGMVLVSGPLAERLRPARVAAEYSPAAAPVMRELPAPRKAIGAPRVIPGEVLASRERIGR
jgi:hypothetical protein